mmetsp:Transcript_52517/g.135980  ORF Transcript_52517/g.135980 Transcript_52517/m.135980 type:complete len:408 (-) Transcript_52517:441-1664(-)
MDSAEVGLHPRGPGLPPHGHLPLGLRLPQPAERGVSDLPEEVGEPAALHGGLDVAARAPGADLRDARFLHAARGGVQVASDLALPEGVDGLREVDLPRVQRAAAPVQGAHAQRTACGRGLCSGHEASDASARLLAALREVRGGLRARGAAYRRAVGRYPAVLRQDHGQKLALVSGLLRLPLRGGGQRGGWQPESIADPRLGGAAGDAHGDDALGEVHALFAGVLETARASCGHGRRLQRSAAGPPLPALRAHPCGVPRRLLRAPHPGARGGTRGRGAGATSAHRVLAGGGPGHRGRHQALASRLGAPWGLLRLRLPGSRAQRQRVLRRAGLAKQRRQQRHGQRPANRQPHRRGQRGEICREQDSIPRWQAGEVGYIFHPLAPHSVVPVHAVGWLLGQPSGLPGTSTQ